MRIEDERESDNVEDRRGASGGGFPIGGMGGLGIGGVLVALAASYFFGIDPSIILSLFQGGGPVTTQAPVSSGPAPRPPESDKKAIFVSRVLASTEDTWSEIFREGGKRYPPPHLVLFTGSFPTARVSASTGDCVVTALAAIASRRATASR
jgi:uncharacterized protein